MREWVERKHGGRTKHKLHTTALVSSDHTLIHRKRVWWTDDGQFIFAQSASGNKGVYTPLEKRAIVTVQTSKIAT